MCMEEFRFHGRVRLNQKSKAKIMKKRTMGGKDKRENIYVIFRDH